MLENEIYCSLLFYHGNSRERQHISEGDFLWENLISFTCIICKWKLLGTPYFIFQRYHPGIINDVSNAKSP